MYAGGDSQMNGGMSHDGGHGGGGHAVGEELEKTGRYRKAPNNSRLLFASSRTPKSKVVA